MVVRKPTGLKNGGQGLPFRGLQRPTLNGLRIVHTGTHAIMLLEFFFKNLHRRFWESEGDFFRRHFYWRRWSGNVQVKKNI